MKQPVDAAYPLTRRERQIIELLAQGWCIKQIAGALGISTGTVKFHVQGIHAKTESQSSGEAVFKVFLAPTWPPHPSGKGIF